MCCLVTVNMSLLTWRNGCAHDPSGEMDVPVTKWNFVPGVAEAVKFCAC